MEWLEQASKLTLTGALVTAVVVLWRENRSLTSKLDALNASRILDLKAIMRLDD